MSFKDHIDNHKTGNYGTVYDIGLPWVACVTDEEVIEYVNYCFEVIELSRVEISNLSLFNDADCVEINELVSVVNGAHSRINTCYKLLNGKLSKVMMDYVHGVRDRANIYTGKLSQGK
jgi:hypothetical protein